MHLHLNEEVGIEKFSIRLLWKRGTKQGVVVI
jgi:hypothetical protein